MSRRNFCPRLYTDVMLTEHNPHIKPNAARNSHQRELIFKLITSVPAVYMGNEKTAAYVNTCENDDGIEFWNSFLSPYGTLDELIDDFSVYYDLNDDAELETL